jgi:hypothetical protein
MNQDTTITPTKTLLYWRKSLASIKPSNVLPVILTLDQSGVFSMKTADNNEVFSKPANELAVRFTGWGTMLVTVDGKEYAFTGIGGSYTPDPSKEQIEEIKAASGADSSENANLNRVGAVGAALSGAGGAGAGAGLAGSAAMQYAYYQGLNNIRDWQQVLEKAGAKVSKSSMKFMMYFTITIAVLVVVFLIIGISNKQ